MILVGYQAVIECAKLNLDFCVSTKKFLFLRLKVENIGLCVE